MTILHQLDLQPEKFYAQMLHENADANILRTFIYTDLEIHEK